MKRFFKSLYIHNRFYIYITCIAVLFLLSYWQPLLFNLAVLLVLFFVLVTLYDGFLLFRSETSFFAERIVPEKLSNSDENQIAIVLRNKYPFRIFLGVIDELPFQFQKRDFYYKTMLQLNQNSTFHYQVTPFERGEYHFGKLNVYVSSMLKILAKRYTFSEETLTKVYPSYVQMKKYEFLAIHNNLTQFGLKKIRRIGHTMEFEQIKSYIPGDDIRTINWKATAKKGVLMVNQYQDEKSQPIYSVIDTGRVMKMPFQGLNLLDYAINATLAFANISLLKNDKSGLITFSKKVEKIVPASSKKTNLSFINEELYNIDTDFLDSDFGVLYANIKRRVHHRSLLMLYTNFEHISALKRQLPYLKSIAKKHLLVVVFFENTELDTLISKKTEDLSSIYHKTIAEKYVYEKRLMLKELERNGLFGLLSKPENLTVNVINKYLEFKAKGMI